MASVTAGNRQTKFSNFEFEPLSFVKITIDPRPVAPYCHPMPKLYLKIGLVLLSMMMACVPLRSVLAWQSPAKKIVVLNNRQTFHGEVDLKDGKYSIGLSSGSRIMLPEDRVMFVCDDLPSAYWELAARTRPTNIAGQIDVFKWCLSNRLFSEAANHLLILQEMDIPAKTMMQLDVSLQITQTQHQRQLDQAAVAASKKIAKAKEASRVKPVPKPAPSRIITGLQPVDSITIPDLHLRADGIAQRLPRAKPSTAENREDAPATSGSTIDQFGNEVDGNVQQVSWDQPVLEHDAAVKISAASSTRPTVSDQIKRRLQSVDTLTYGNLDRLAFSMPRGSVGLFRKQVEPLLQKSCVQCHQSRGDAECIFEIYQSPTGSIDRRMSQKNLYQSLILSQHDRPEKSPLLNFATTAHGNQKTSSFLFSDPSLEPLKRWLIMISDNPSLAVGELQGDKSSVEVFSETPSSPSAFTHQQQSSSNSDPGNSQLGSATRAPAHTKVNTPIESVDEFDADIFNQKFR